MKMIHLHTTQQYVKESSIPLPPSSTIEVEKNRDICYLLCNKNYKCGAVTSTPRMTGIHLLLNVPGKIDYLAREALLAHNEKTGLPLLLLWSRKKVESLSEITWKKVLYIQRIRINNEFGPFLLGFHAVQEKMDLGVKGYSFPKWCNPTMDWGDLSDNGNSNYTHKIEF